MPNRSFLYGDGLFETVRVTEQGPWNVANHCARLKRSFEALGYPREFQARALEVLTTLKGVGLHRLTFVRPPLMPLRGDGGTIDHHVRPLPVLEPLKLGIHPGTYFPGDRLAEHKTTSFVRAVETLRLATEKGYDDALRVSDDGLIGESAIRNVYLKLDGAWVTPSARGLLPGTVRALLIERGVTERTVLASELDRAQAVALSSSAGIVGVCQIHERRLDLRHFELSQRLEDVE